MCLSVNRYLRIPYSECDCWELVRKVYLEEFHIQLPRLSGERQMIEESGWRIVVDEKPGDVIVFRMDVLKRHVGIITDEKRGHFLHADERLDSVIERYRSPTWRNRVQRFYRHKDR